MTDRGRREQAWRRRRSDAMLSQTSKTNFARARGGSRGHPPAPLPLLSCARVKLSRHPSCALVLRRSRLATPCADAAPSLAAAAARHRRLAAMDGADAGAGKRPTPDAPETASTPAAKRVRSACAFVRARRCLARAAKTRASRFAASHRRRRHPAAAPGCPGCARAHVAEGQGSARAHQRRRLGRAVQQGATPLSLLPTAA